jgi:hypothetical protein
MSVLQALQVLAAVLVAVTMGLTLAHALELPGKLRLSRDAYLAVQPIYYPGFTIGGGVGEAGGLVALLLLVVLTPKGTAAFWLTLAAFVALLATHAVYWIATHPVNNFWLRDVELKGFGGRFFLFDPWRRARALGAPDWTILRDQWEYSHVLRAGLALLSLILLTAAIAV